MNSRLPLARRTLAVILAAAALMTVSIAPAQAYDEFVKRYGPKQCYTYGVLSQLITTETGKHTHWQVNMDGNRKTGIFYTRRESLWSGYTQIWDGYQGSNAFISDSSRMFCDR